MPTGIYDRSKSKPRPRKSDKPQASTGKAPKAIKKPAVKRAPRKKASLAKAFPLTGQAIERDPVASAMLKDVLGHFPGEVVDAEVRPPRVVEVTPEVHGWLAVTAKARGVAITIVLEELVMRHIQLGLS